jgi:hypothetical protein
MKKFLSFVGRIINIILGVFQGRGWGSIDAAERKDQIKNRDAEEKEVRDAVNDGKVDDLNDMFGWKK